MRTVQNPSNLRSRENFHSLDQQNLKEVKQNNQSTDFCCSSWRLKLSKKGDRNISLCARSISNRIFCRFCKKTFLFWTNNFFGQIPLHWIYEGENNPLNVFLIFRELRWKLGSNPTQWESWNPHFKELRFPDKSLNHFSNKSDLIKHRLSLMKWPNKNGDFFKKTTTTFINFFFWVSIIFQHQSAE